MAARRRAAIRGENARKEHQELKPVAPGLAETSWPAYSRFAIPSKAAAVLDARCADEPSAADDGVYLDLYEPAGIEEPLDDDEALAGRILPKASPCTCPTASP
jgi:hypothetical protein